MTKVRLCFHDRCFDGTASAAVFYRFYRERIDGKAVFQFTGMTHKAKHPWVFDGDENAIVDFKYSSSPRVTWWFDHHQSAFLTPADAENFRQDRGGHKFYDPDYKSCTKLIADVTSAKFGFDVQAARRADSLGRHHRRRAVCYAGIGVALTEPATQLALVIERRRKTASGAENYPGHVRAAAGGNDQAADCAASGPLLERHHRRSIDIMRERMDVRGGVIYFDMSDLDIEGYNKFIPYMLHPEARYTVSV
jgi:hypothetical protein